jgi:solute:Na+ symporter, SSS family
MDMQLSTTTIVLVLYLLILVFIALSSRTKVKTYADFFVASKKGGYMAVTGSLIATILGGSAVIGSIDAGTTMGWASAWFMLTAAAGLLALIPLTKKISQLGKFTLPELLGNMFGDRAKLISSVIIPLAWLGIIAAQVIASAKILQSFTGMGYATGVVISGLVFTLYTIAGGQISILKTDSVQSLLIIAGMITIAAFAFFAPNEANFSPTILKFPFNSNFSPIDLFVLVITYGTTFTVGPDMYSRIFCAKNHVVARKALFTTAMVLIPIAFIIGYLSIFNIEAIQGAKLINISLQVLPYWLTPLVVVALLSAVLSSADTTLLSSSIIITDLIEKHNFGDKSLGITRIVVAVTGVASMIIAFYFNSIIEMLLIALTVYSGAFTMPIIAGLLGWKIKPLMVSLAMVSGGLIALAGKLVAMFSNNLMGNLIIVAAFLFSTSMLIFGTSLKPFRK